MKLNNEDNKLKMSLQLLASDNIDNDDEKDEDLNEANNEEQKPEVKMLTQEEVNKLVARAKKKEREKAEAELKKQYEEKIAEEKRLALLSEKERQAELDKKEREEFLKQKAEFQKEKMMLETEKLLKKEGLNEGLASYVVRDTAEDTLAEINKMKEIFSKGYEETIKDRLKGNAPRKAQGAVVDPFMQGFSN